MPIMPMVMSGGRVSVAPPPWISRISAAGKVRPGGVRKCAMSAGSGCRRAMVKSRMAASKANRRGVWASAASGERGFMPARGFRCGRARRRPCRAARVEQPWSG